MTEFGDAFRKARIKKRLTLREIGKHMNRSISNLSDMEHGRKDPPLNIDWITKLENLLCVEFGYLLMAVRKDIPKCPKCGAIIKG